MNVIPIKPGSFRRNFIPLYMLHGIFLILFSMHLKIKMKTTSLTVYLNRSLSLPEVSNNSNKLEKKLLNRQRKYQRIRRLEIRAFSSAHLLLVCPDIQMEDRRSARGSGIPTKRLWKDSTGSRPIPRMHWGSVGLSSHVVFTHTFIFFSYFFSKRPPSFLSRCCDESLGRFM